VEKNDEFENGRKKPIKKILYIIVILEPVDTKLKI